MATMKFLYNGLYKAIKFKEKDLTITVIENGQAIVEKNGQLIGIYKATPKWIKKLKEAWK